MTYENDLLDTYMNEVQPLFCETEVIDRNIPLNSLERIHQFFGMLSLCACEDGNPSEAQIEEARGYLTMAKYHCHCVLTSAYCEQGKTKMEQYGYSALKTANNAMLLPDLQRKQNAMQTAILSAKKARHAEEERIRDEFGIPALQDESEGTISFVESELAKSAEVRNATKASYDAAKTFYETLMDSNSKIAYNKDHGEQERDIDRRLRMIGQVLTVIGLVGIAVFIIRRVMGV